MDRLNYVSPEDQSPESRARQISRDGRTPLKPTGKEAELAAALKKSRRRSGSSGSAGRDKTLLNISPLPIVWR